MDIVDRLNMRSEYQILNDAIRDEIRRSASSVVSLGYMLRRMMDEKLWEGHYDSLDEYLRQELHMDYTMACRFEAINRKYSIGGRNVHIDDKWEDYSQSVLIEMLNMPPELEEKVTPDMTVRQVRELKRQARQEKQEKSAETAPQPPEHVQGEIPDAEFREVEMPAEDAVQCPETQEETAASCQEPEKVATSQLEKSAYGLEKTVYPEGSLTAEAGCGNKYHCFSCAQDCGIRQKYRYCSFAPLGNPFACDRMEILEEIREEAGERCQFINNDLADHKAGTGEAAPCCTNCREECAFRCRRSCRMEADKQQKTGDSSTPEENQEDGIRDELAEMRRVLKEEQKTLDDYMAVDAEEPLPAEMMFRQRAVVTALSEMLDRMEEAEAEPEPEEREQPSLPVLKNNDRRREWLRSYKDWGLWYRDENIGVDYYKYDFENGARLIAEVYQEEATKYHDAYESAYFHLVGGPEAQKNQNGVCRWQWHAKYSRYPNSETELVEFLKEAQKGRK